MVVVISLLAIAWHRKMKEQKKLLEASSHNSEDSSSGGEETEDYQLMTPPVDDDREDESNRDAAVPVRTDTDVAPIAKRPSTLIESVEEIAQNLFGSRHSYSEMERPDTAVAVPTFRRPTWPLIQASLPSIDANKRPLQIHEIGRATRRHISHVLGQLARAYADARPSHVQVKTEDYEDDDYECSETECLMNQWGVDEDEIQQDSRPPYIGV